MVKFEQEIDRELAAEKAALENRCAQANHAGCHDDDQRLNPTGDKLASHVNESRYSRSGQRSFNGFGKDGLPGYSGTATDDLIIRCYMRKEEEAAKKKEAEERLKRQQDEEMKEVTPVSHNSTPRDDCTPSSTSGEDETATAKATDLTGFDDPNCVNEVVKQINSTNCDDGSDAIASKASKLESSLLVAVQTIRPVAYVDDASNRGADKSESLKSPSSSAASPNKNGLLMYDSRVDSLDSGEGRTESSAASTSQNGTRNNSLSCASDANRKHETSSSIPVAITRSDSSSPLTSSNHTSSMGTSELSSSRSSLLSVQDSNSTYTSSSAAKTSSRHVASSDLDGKVMRIAKSYYGKGVTKGVKRLSEGKYKIADRIVFVRLLKGHRVMVRIGGGWDTLENFLFRHKSDPSQIIDVDNLLPIETKMSFDKNSSVNNNLVN